MTLSRHLARARSARFRRRARNKSAGSEISTIWRLSSRSSRPFRLACPPARLLFAQAAAGAGGDSSPNRQPAARHLPGVGAFIIVGRPEPLGDRAPAPSYKTQIFISISCLLLRSHRPLVELNERKCRFHFKARAASLHFNLRPSCADRLTGRPADLAPKVSRQMSDAPRPTGMFAIGPP